MLELRSAVAHLDFGCADYSIHNDDPFATRSEHLKQVCEQRCNTSSTWGTFHSVDVGPAYINEFQREAQVP